MGAGTISNWIKELPSSNEKIMLKDLNSFSKNIKGKIKFDYSLKNHTWLNIGGNAKIFFCSRNFN